MKIDLASRKRSDGIAGRHVLPWLGLLFAGAASLGIWFLIKPTLGPDPYYRVGYNSSTTEYSFQILLLFVPYALALIAWRRGSRIPLWVLLAGAVALHLLVLFAPLPQSQDFYQYLFYGRMQVVHHANPYLVQPRVFWSDPWFPWAQWHGQTSVYGPVWSLLSAGAVRAAGNSLPVAFFTFKLVVFSLDMAIIAMLVRIARHRPDPEGSAGWGLLAYAWNPLVLITVPLAGAADVAVAAALLGGLLARKRGRMGLATVLLTLAPLVKIYAAVGLLLHLVLLARQRGWKEAARHSALATGVAGLLYLPYWAGVRTFGGIMQATGLTNESLTGTLQRLLIPVVHGLGFASPHLTNHVVRVISTAALLAALVYVVTKVRDERTLWELTVLGMAAYLYLTPWFSYWYMVGPLALIAAMPRNRLTFPMLTFSASVFTVLWVPGRLVDWVAQTAIRYVPPVAAFLRWKPERHTRGSAHSTVPVGVPAGTAITQRASAAK